MLKTVDLRTKRIFIAADISEENKKEISKFYKKVLQKELKNKLIKAGFTIEKRPFQPHLTLGRIKPCSLRQREEIGRQLKKLRILDLRSRIQVNKLTVYHSHLSSKGSVYEVVKRLFFM